MTRKINNLILAVVFLLTASAFGSCGCAMAAETPAKAAAPQAVSCHHEQAPPRLGRGLPFT